MVSGFEPPNLGSLVSFFTKEPLLKGKAQYSWPPCTNLFRFVSFEFACIIYSFAKQVTFVEEVNRTEPSPLVSVPRFLSLPLAAPSKKNLGDR